MSPELKTTQVQLGKINDEIKAILKICCSSENFGNVSHKTLEILWRKFIAIALKLQEKDIYIYNYNRGPTSMLCETFNIMALNWIRSVTKFALARRCCATGR